MSKKKAKPSNSAGIFDKLYSNIIVPLFEGLSDKRAENSSYGQTDALKSGFAIYSLKFASLFSFRKKSKAEDSNLKQVYGIKKIPSDNGLRKILDKIIPKQLHEGFHQIFMWLSENGVINKFRYWRGYMVVSVDGVEHFCSEKVSCQHCLHRKLKNGKVQNYHAMLSAAIVQPDRKEVIPLANEPIIKQDGSTKNDCEQNAAKRLLGSFKSLYSNELMVFAFDALYACGPIVEILAECEKWKFVINVKPTSHKSLFRQFEARDSRGQVTWKTSTDKKGTHKFGFTNNLALNDTHTNLRVNMLFYQFTDLKGLTTTFSWITNIKLLKSNVYIVMRIGRSRWKIENETFNTLKNQGYHFEHNFGHGEQNLCTVFAFLMMLAFCLDQIQQLKCKYFKPVLQDLKTKAKLWESLRAVFKIVPCKNMTYIFICIADMYQIRLI